MCVYLHRCHLRVYGDLVSIGSMADCDLLVRVLRSEDQRGERQLSRGGGARSACCRLHDKTWNGRVNPLGLTRHKLRVNPIELVLRFYPR